MPNLYFSFLQTNRFQNDNHDSPSSLNSMMKWDTHGIIDDLENESQSELGASTNPYVHSQCISSLLSTEKKATKDDNSESSIAHTLDGRLLCASNVAYQSSFNVTSSSTEGKITNYFKAVQYKKGTNATRITKSVNSVFIGTNVDGIIVSFRGTITNSPLDWLQNAALLMKRVFINVKERIKMGDKRTNIKDENHDETKKRIILPGKVHSGFLKAVQSIWKPLVIEVQNRIESYSTSSSDIQETPKLYFCGHSKGGAMASLAAIIFNLDPSLPNVTSVTTFASAKVGNSAFRDVYNRVVNQTSYESYLDIVPFLPPSKSTMEVCSENMKSMMDEYVNAILFCFNTCASVYYYYYYYHVYIYKYLILYNLPNRFMIDMKKVCFGQKEPIPRKGTHFIGIINQLENEFILMKMHK